MSAIVKRKSQRVYQHEPLVTPSGWQGDEQQLVIRLTQILDDIYQKYGTLLNKYNTQSADASSAAESASSMLFPGAGAHNAVYRGKYLGSAVTDAQWAAISAGTFDDLYIGDYWTIDGVNYRIAAFDYYYNTGDTECTTHHVTIVPDLNMYRNAMNDTGTTAGAYANSKMYTSGLNDAKTTIRNAFGAEHILNHRQYLQNAVTNGYASGESWYDSEVELMTEQNVYGCTILGNCINGTNHPYSYTIDKSQYPLFAYRNDLIKSDFIFWLRDVSSSKYFCTVHNDGCANVNSAEYKFGVRPSFSIC